MADKYDPATSKLLAEQFASVQKATADNWISVCSIALTKATEAIAADSRRRARQVSAQARAIKGK